MGDHSHHGHHAHHSHQMTTANNTVFGDLPTTTAATVVQAVMTTIMTDHQHQGHDQMVSDAAQDTFVHSQHITSGGGHGSMVFHFGVDTVILFKEWTTSTTEGLIFSVIGIIIMAMLYEGLKFFREFLFKKYFTSLEYSSVSVLGDDGKPVTEVHKVARNRMLSWPHFIQTFLHVVQMIVSYFLMFICMTFNVWLFLAVIIGSGIGYFLFGWRKATVVDITEHCH